MRWLLAILLLATGCDVKLAVAKPLGRITVPNKIGMFPPGALEIAQNVVLREPGVLSSMPGLQTLRANAMPNGDTARIIWSGDAYQLVISQQGGTWSVRWVDAAGATVVTSPSAFAHSFDTGIAPVVRQRGRTIVGTSNGPIVLDSETDAAARLAGLGQPLVYSSLRNHVSASAAIAEDKQAGYTARIVRRHSDGFETFSPFSGRYVVGNPAGSGSADVDITVALESNTGVAAGDRIELYRTKAEAIGVDVGDTYYLAAIGTVFAGHVTAARYDINDNVPDVQLGRESSHSPGQGGPLKDNFAPPLARDIVQHGGHTLYLGTTTPARLVEYVAGRVDSPLAASDRLLGLGQRAFTADTTNGSPTLTAISAADMVGLSVGQQVSFGAVTGNIVSLGLSSITLDANATATAAGVACSAFDQMKINGVDTFISTFWFWRGNLAAPQITASGVDPLTFSSTEDQADYSGAPAPAGFEFSIGRQFFHEGSFTIQASNGQNYNPPIAGYADSAQTVSPEVKLNRVHWSEAELPETVPLLNRFFVGSGEIYRGVFVDTVTLVFASDGLFQIRGDGINGFAVERKDPTLYLAGRFAVDVLGKRAYAYTNRGFVSITPDGDVEMLGLPIIGGKAQYSDTWDIRVVADHEHHEVYFTTDAGVTWNVYNVLTGAFTTFAPTTQAPAMAFSKALASLVLATATAGGPSVESFNADSSLTRLANASVRFQPVFGADPAAVHEWGSAEYAFEGFTAGATLVPSFSGTNYTAHAVPANASESRAVVRVPKGAPAYSDKLRPGFTFSAGGTTQLWSLRLMAIRYRQVGELGVPR